LSAEFRNGILCNFVQKEGQFCNIDSQSIPTLKYPAGQYPDTTGVIESVLGVGGVRMPTGRWHMNTLGVSQCRFNQFPDKKNVLIKSKIAMTKKRVNLFCNYCLYIYIYIFESLIIITTSLKLHYVNTWEEVKIPIRYL